MFAPYGRGSGDQLPLWRVDVGRVASHGIMGRRRRLVFEPSCPRPDTVMWNAWVEEEQAKVTWTADASSPNPRPKGVGLYSSDWVILKRSQQPVLLVNSFR